MTPLQRERFWASLHVRRIHPNAIRRGIYRTLGTRLLPWALAILAGGLVAAVGAVVPGIAVGGAAQHGDRGCLLSLLESAQDEADWAKQAQLAPEHVRAEVERTVALRERVMRKPVVGPHLGSCSASGAEAPARSSCHVADQDSRQLTH
jgi:hypothetical protein